MRGWMWPVEWRRWADRTPHPARVPLATLSPEGRGLKGAELGLERQAAALPLPLAFFFARRARLGRSCLAMKALTWGAMTSRQRRPLKMP